MYSLEPFVDTVSFPFLFRFFRVNGFAGKSGGSVNFTTEESVPHVLLVVSDRSLSPPSRHYSLISLPFWGL